MKNKIVTFDKMHSKIDPSKHMKFFKAEVSIEEANEMLKFDIMIMNIMFFLLGVVITFLISTLLG